MPHVPGRVLFPLKCWSLPGLKMWWGAGHVVGGTSWLDSLRQPGSGPWSPDEGTGRRTACPQQGMSSGASEGHVG